MGNRGCFRSAGDLARDVGTGSDDRARKALATTVTRNARRSDFGDPRDLCRVPVDDIVAEPLSKRCATGAAAVTIHKQLTGNALPGTPDQRIVLGIVLEPTRELGVPDTQGDLYSAAEVRAAKESWDRAGRTMGVQHSRLTDRVEVLDSFILEADSVVNNQAVAAGTWLAVVRVNDPELWAAVKSGALSGFSIGGTAVRTSLT